MRTPKLVGVIGVATACWTGPENRKVGPCGSLACGGGTPFKDGD